MKAKIFFVLGIVALITLSFTFSSNAPSHSTPQTQETPKSLNDTGEIAGFISDQVVK